MTNVTTFNGTEDEIKASNEKMKRYMPEMIEYAAAVAKLKREFFVALKKEGFSDSEALELTKGYLT